MRLMQLMRLRVVVPAVRLRPRQSVCSVRSAHDKRVCSQQHDVASACVIASSNWTLQMYPSCRAGTNSASFSGPYSTFSTRRLADMQQELRC